MSIGGSLDVGGHIPTPSAAALAHSQRLVSMIEASIRAEYGGLAFDRFMEAALYAPGLGYYVAGARKFGPGGEGGGAPRVKSVLEGEECDRFVPGTDVGWELIEKAAEVEGLI